MRLQLVQSFSNPKQLQGTFNKAQRHSCAADTPCYGGNRGQSGPTEGDSV